MNGGFGTGFLKGSLISVVVVAAISLAVPLKTQDPGQVSQTELTTPSGSGFNVGRADTTPVLPDTDQTVAKETLAKPAPPDPAGTAPARQTAPSAQPVSDQTQEMPQPAAIETNNAVVAPAPDTAPALAPKAPVVSPPALGLPMPAIENPVAPTSAAKLPVGQTSDTATLEIAAKPAVLAPPKPETLIQRDPAHPLDPALVRNKVAFANTTGKPLFAVVLIDAGAKGLSADILSTFTFPVTFAIAPDSPAATRTANDLSTAGFEILALAPTGAAQLEARKNPAALATALNEVMAAVPPAIGLIDQPNALLQKTPELAKQVIAALAASGYGLVTYNIGLNGTDSRARKAGVKSGTVFRVLDRNGENSATIKRYLNRAVLEAGKTGSVIVVGHSYQQTVTALFSWSLSAKATEVTLAPVSAVLLAR